MNTRPFQPLPPDRGRIHTPLLLLFFFLTLIVLGIGTGIFFFIVWASGALN